MYKNDTKICHLLVNFKKQYPKATNVTIVDKLKQQSSEMGNRKVRNKFTITGLINRTNLQKLIPFKKHSKKNDYLN